MNEGNWLTVRPMRAKIYARNNNPQRLADNVAEALAIAAEHGIDVAESDIVAECASAANIYEQPRFKALIDEVDSGGVSHLIATNWKRLARTGDDVNKIEEALAAGKVTLVTAEGTEDYSHSSSVRELRRAICRAAIEANGRVARRKQRSGTLMELR